MGTGAIDVKPLTVQLWARGDDPIDVPARIALVVS